MNPNETTLYPCHNVLKVDYCRSKKENQHGALSHRALQALTKPKMTSVKQVKQKNKKQFNRNEFKEVLI